LPEASLRTSPSMRYDAIHKWVRRHKEKVGICSQCGVGYAGSPFHTEWANISGIYRRELDDYIELCKSCHFKLDYPDGHPNQFKPK